MDPAAPAPVDVPFGELLGAGGDLEPWCPECAGARRVRDPLTDIYRPCSACTPPAGAPFGHPCEVLGNAYHSDAPCGPQHQPAPECVCATLRPGGECGRTRSTRPPTSRRRCSVLNGSRGAGCLGTTPPRCTSLRGRCWPAGGAADRPAVAGRPGGGPGRRGRVRGLGHGRRPQRGRDRGRGPGRRGRERPVRRGAGAGRDPGEDYTGTRARRDEGRTEAGLFGGYLWASATRDLAQAVLQRGPVVVGVPWLSGMSDTGPGGLVQLTGDRHRAGHCLAVVGLTAPRPAGTARPVLRVAELLGRRVRGRRPGLRAPPGPRYPAARRRGGRGAHPVTGGWWLATATATRVGAHP